MWVPAEYDHAITRNWWLGHKAGVQEDVQEGESEALGPEGRV